MSNNSQQNNPATFQLFDKVLAEVRAYFVLARPEDMASAGTREMVYRWVCKRVGQDVPPLLVSAALKVLKERNAIIFDRRVWWFIADR